MRRVLLAAMSSFALGADPAAGQLLKATIDVADMRVVVAFVSAAELAALQRKHGATLGIRDLRQNHRRGFSILKTNVATGARTCEIYLPEDRRPREVDDDGTLSLGHELLHCMYGNYHR
jgi:hypothetical protein